jgi:hypothetical protein
LEVGGLRLEAISRKVEGRNVGGLKLEVESQSPCFTSDLQPLTSNIP